MKDENGIEICCKNCNDDVAINCPHYNPDNPDEDFGCVVFGGFVPSYDALFARIAELQKELTVIQASERAEAQEADRLRAEVKELGAKLTGTVKLLSEQSRECGKLEAYNEVLQRRIEEFSMELLDRTMKENKDVLERLKKAESEELQ